MNDDPEQRIKEARKILDFFANPAIVIFGYFAIVIPLSFLLNEPPSWLYCAIFFTLFGIYMLASWLRRSLLTKKERDVEDEEYEKDMSRRGP